MCVEELDLVKSAEKMVKVEVRPDGQYYNDGDVVLKEKNGLYSVDDRVGCNIFLSDCEMSAHAFALGLAVGMQVEATGKIPSEFGSEKK